MIPITVTVARPDLWENLSLFYPGASLSLPATSTEIQDAMDRARITDNQPYKLIDIRDVNGFEMSPLPINPPLDLLNILAHKLGGLDESEQIQFLAMCKMEAEPPSMLRLINMTENLKDIITVPARDYAELGRFYLDNDMVDGLSGLSEELYQSLDPDKIGRMKHKEENGMFIGTGNFKYYAINYATEFREIYTESNLPKLPQEDAGCIFKFTVENKEAGVNTVIKLPAKLENIIDLLDEINMVDISDCEIKSAKCLVPGLSRRIYKPYEIYDLNSLAINCQIL